MNKKIKNAATAHYDGIAFKSQLEKDTYIALKEAGFNPVYERYKITLWNGFKPTVPFYSLSKRKQILRPLYTRLKDMTYTPDFVISVKGYTIFIEVKGYYNDVYPIKKKLFRQYLENTQTEDSRYVYFEVRSKREVYQMINIINNHEYIKKDKGTAKSSSRKRQRAGKRVS